MSTLLPHHPPQSKPVFMSTPQASTSPAAPHSTENGTDEEDSTEEDGTYPIVNPLITTELKVERMSEEVQMPERQNRQDAAFDLRAYINGLPEGDFEERILVPVGARVLISTGLKVALPPTMEMQIRPRSGLANDHGIDVANSPGTVDPGYRGEVKVILENKGDEPFAVENGDRIAQAAIRPVVHPEFEEVDEVPEDTERGTGGFGSTGV